MTTSQLILITLLAMLVIILAVRLHFYMIDIPTYECSRTDKGAKCFMECEGCKDFKQMYATPERAIACYKLRIEIVEEIQQQVRMLKNSETHVCPCLDNPKGECSCHKYEQVIDELDKLKEL